MRLDPKLVHPSIFKAADAAMWGVSAKNPQAVAAHQTQWFKEYGAGCAAYALGSLGVFVACAFALKAFEVDRPVRLIVLLFMMGIALVLGGFHMARNMRQMTPAELEALLPALDLNATQKAYAETLVALHRSGSPQADVDETMGALNALLDEETRLTALRERLAGRGEENGPATLETEGDALRERLAATADPLARDAYAQSLGLLEERIAAFRAGDVGLERVDAHLSLLRQAVLATRDAARRLDAAPSSVGTDLATDSLRSAVAHARIQTQATEQALAELRAI